MKWCFQRFDLFSKESIPLLEENVGKTNTTSPAEIITLNKRNIQDKLEGETSSLKIKNASDPRLAQTRLLWRYRQRKRESYNEDVTSSNSGDLKIHIDANKEPDRLKKEPLQPWWALNDTYGGAETGLMEADTL